MLLPAPVGPTIAITCPAFGDEVDVVQHRPIGGVLEAHVLERRPRRAASSPSSERVPSGRSGAVSRISSARVAPARAPWIMPMVWLMLLIGA